MNRRHCALATLFAMIGMWAGGARGQAAAGGGAAGAATPPKPAAPAPAPVAPPSPPAPVTVPIAAYSAPGSQLPAIEDFVGKNVSNLLNDADPAGQAKSRDNLIAATQTAGVPASPAFLFEYGRILNGAFLPKLSAKPAPSLRQRLNIAIVTARVADAAGNITLVPTATAIVKDSAEPVILWGLRAAKPLIPQLVKMKAPGGVSPLITAIAPAVLAHPSGPLFQEAYSSLDVPDKTTMAELLKLWGNRLAQYQGKEPPDDPGVDGRPVLTLTTGEMWKNVLNDKAAQSRAMQMVSDQTSVAAQWADQTPAGDKHDDLVRLVQQCAAGCQVVGQNTNDKGLVAAADPAVKMKLDAFGGGGSSTKMVPLIAPVVDAIHAAFPDVKPPPQVGAAAAGVAGQQ
jgi:hypothetical protein